MKYLLDTNTCIQYLKGKSQSVFLRLNALPLNEIAVCSVVKFELHYGALKSNYGERTIQEQAQFLRRFRSLPFDDAAHTHAAQIRVALERIGKPIGHYDLLIAAIALANNLTLVTHNTDEFQRVPGLRIEDWEADPPS